MAATPTAVAGGYPVGVVDPTGYDPERIAVWTDRWIQSGGRKTSVGNVGPELPTGQPALRVAGLDTLYSYIPSAWSWERARRNPEYDPTDPICATEPGRPQCEEWLSEVSTVCGTPSGSPFGNEPIVLRFDDPYSPQGRVVWIGTPLYFFTQNGADPFLRDLMRSLTDWAMEVGP
jgi:hypothetical protein